VSVTLHPRPARWLKCVLADPHLTEDDRLVARAVAAHMDHRCRVSATDAQIARWVAELQVAQS